MMRGGEKDEKGENAIKVSWRYQAIVKVQQASVGLKNKQNTIWRNNKVCIIIYAWEKLYKPYYENSLYTVGEQCVRT